MGSLYQSEVEKMMEALKELERQILGDEVARMSPTIEEAWGDDFRKAVDKAVDIAVSEDRLTIAVDMVKGGYDIDEIIRLTRVKREDLEQLFSKGFNGKDKASWSSVVADSDFTLANWLQRQ